MGKKIENPTAWKYEAPVSIPSATGIGWVIKALSDDTTRPMLQCLRVEPTDGGRTAIIASDGRRLHKIELVMVLPEGEYAVLASDRNTVTIARITDETAPQYPNWRLVVPGMPDNRNTIDCLKDADGPLVFSFENKGKTFREMQDWQFSFQIPPYINYSYMADLGSGSWISSYCITDGKPNPEKALRFDDRNRLAVIMPMVR